jgi:hypothetical protein
LYIAGYGRSGSTILDLKLGEKFGFVSLGEVSAIYSDISFYNAARCGCGARYRDCPLWGPFASDPENRRRVCLSRVYQSPKYLSPVLRFFYFLKGVRKLRRGEFLTAVRRPLERVTQHYPGGIYVDSSKSAWFTIHRPEVLAEIGQRVIVVHIRRPLKDVLASVRQGDNRVLMGDKEKGKLFPVPRAILTYYVANAYASRLQHKFPYILVSQVELRDSEDAVLGRVFDFVTSHFGADYNRYDASHIVSGNRLKLVARRADPAARDSR